MDNDKLAEARETIFKAELKKLETEVLAAPPDLFKIEAQVQVVRSKYEALMEITEKVMEKHIEENKMQDFIKLEEKRTDYFRDIQLQELKAAKITTPDPTPTPVKKSDASYRTNLPQRKLQEFSGDIRDWLGFWSSFEDIDQDAGISDADKFQYLLQCIPKSSSARKCIDGFAVSAKNYRAAVNTLRNLYGRDNLLIKVYVRDLLQLVIRNAQGGNKIEFMDLYPKLSSHIRNLEELGVTSDKCEEILYPVVESCLPEDILLAWQRNPKYEEKLEELMTFLNAEVHNKMDRSLAKMQFSTELQQKKGKDKKDKNEDIPTATGFMATYVPPGGKDKKQKGKEPCGFCGDSRHKGEKCGKAKMSMTLEEKLAALKERRCCFRCLRPGHNSNKCTHFVRCCICMGNHYEVICNGKKEQERGMMMALSNKQDSFEDGNHFGSSHGDSGYHHRPPQQQQSGLNSSFGNAQQRQNDQGKGGNGPPSSTPRTGMSNFTSGAGVVTLQTFFAILETPKGKWRVRIFVDEGSDESYVDKRCAEDTGCVIVGGQTMTHQLFGGVITEPVHHSQYKVKLVSLNRKAEMEFVLNAIPKIAHGISRPHIGPWIKELQEKGVFFTEQSDGSDEVQILMGMDTAAQIWTGGFHRINPVLYTKETIFGWVLGGKQSLSSSSEKVARTNMVTSMMVSQHSVEELWALEALGIMEESKSQSKEDLEKATIAYFEQTVQRKQTGRYVVQLPWIEGHRKITGNFNQAFARLQNTTKDLKKQNYWEAYDRIFLDWEQEGIITEVKVEEQKLKELYLLPHRHVVKESSSTTPVRPVFDASAKGKGGPSLNDCLEKGPNLLELIPAIMCRFRKEKIAAVSDVKKAFLQIEVAEKDQEVLYFLWWKDISCKELKVYRHVRVVFGVKPSPFLLAATLKYHLERHCKETDFRGKLLNSLYVDNSCSSHASMEDALLFKEESVKLLLPAHFDLRGWEFSYSSEKNTVPVLGMLWETKSDTISLCMDSPEKRMSAPMTKRGLLALVNSIFDPMGYVCAFTILPKLLLQECCNLKLDWDDPLPENLAEKLQKWRIQVPELKKIEIPRWMYLSGDNSGVSIHCFSDASGAAFATYVFVRREIGQQVLVQLVMGKSRVAPAKKKVTIPSKVLELEDVPRHFHSDSTTALAWIKQDKDWARFVANRVAVIRKLTKPEEWHHVPGEQNPADIPSRGSSASRLLETRFWEGPEWLRMPPSCWPNSTAYINEEDVNAEKKKVVVSAHAKVQDTVLRRLVKFADFHKTLRVTAYVIRFADALKESVLKKKQKIEKTIKKSKVDPSSAEMIQRAEKRVLEWIQKESFNGLEDSRLRAMGAFCDKEGLIRVKSQLLFGNDDFGLRCPVVLPYEHPMVKVLIQKEHELQSHAGVQIVQAVLRNRFWILRSRRTISGVIQACPTCKRFTAKRCEIPTVPLPLDRIRDTVAFDVTGVDLAGPLILRGGQKVWIVLFTCAVYRALHLELVTTLSTRGFIMAFQRFIARRGRPSTVYSDNGLNFVGCANAFKKIDWEEVQRYGSVERINWRFNPPTAAWWGGWWERLVGLTKQLLRRVLGKKSVEYEELLTILCDVEGSLNQRPLTYVSDRKEELRPLCPANFMRDNPQSNLPEVEIVDDNDLRNSAKVCQKLREDLRSRFRKEYLGQLQHRAGVKIRTVKPGDVVIVEDENRKRLEWQLGVVRDTYTGRGDVVSTALVKTADGEFLRPVQRLFIMEAAQDTNEEFQRTGAVTRFGRKIAKPDRLGLK